MALFSKVFPHVYLLESAHVLPAEVGDCPENQRKEALHRILRPQQGWIMWLQSPLPIKPNFVVLWIGSCTQRVFAFLALSLVQKESKGWREVQPSEVLSNRRWPSKTPGKWTGGKEGANRWLYRWGRRENENWVSQQNYRDCFNRQKYCRVRSPLVSASCQPAVTHSALYLCARCKQHVLTSVFMFRFSKIFDFLKK